MLSKYSWARHCSFEHGPLIRNHVLKEKGLPLFQKQLIANSSSLRGRISARFTPSCWDFVWVEFVPVLWMLSQALWVGIHHCPVVFRRQFPPSHPEPLAPPVFWPPLLQCSLSLGGRAVVYMSYLGLNVSRSLTLCTLTRQGFYVAGHCMRKLFWWELRKELFYGYSTKATGSVSCCVHLAGSQS